MNILYVCTYYHRAMIFRDSMNYLEARGHNIIAFNAVAKGTVIDDKYKAIMDEKVIHKECFNKFDRFFFELKQKKILRAIETSLDIKEFDLIHSHTLFNGGWAAYQLYRKRGIPFYVSVRDTDLNVFLKIPTFKRKARKIVEDASGVVFLSGAYKNQFLDLCFAESERKTVNEKCVVIPNGLEPFWLENIYRQRIEVHNPLELLCVGKIDKRKNLLTTVRVVERLYKNGTLVHLTVIGQVLDNNVKAVLDKSAHVSVIPFMPKDRLIEYYRKADIFIMPSFTETFGRVYAEAMTQGLPVIYTKGQGFDGNFEDGVVGYSVIADDVEGITKAVQNIIDAYPQISQNCVDKCRIFNWTDIAERLEKIYSKSL